MLFGMKNNVVTFVFFPSMHNHLVKRGFRRHVFAFFHVFFRGDQRHKYLGLQNIRVISYVFQPEKQRGDHRFFLNMRNHLAQKCFRRHVFPIFFHFFRGD